MTDELSPCIAYALGDNALKLGIVCQCARCKAERAANGIEQRDAGHGDKDTAERQPKTPIPDRKKEAAGDCDE